MFGRWWLYARTQTQGPFAHTCEDLTEIRRQKNGYNPLVIVVSCRDHDMGSFPGGVVRVSPPPLADRWRSWFRVTRATWKKAKRSCFFFSGQNKYQVLNSPDPERSRRTPPPLSPSLPPSLPETKRVSQSYHQLDGQRVRLPKNEAPTAKGGRPGPMPRRTWPTGQAGSLGLVGKQHRRAPPRNGQALQAEKTRP